MKIFPLIVVFGIGWVVGMAFGYSRGYVRGQAFAVKSIREGWMKP